MRDEYFGVKELREVVLRAKTPMYFGSRYIEAEEPVFCFENIMMSTLSEQSKPVMARGGWANMPRVIWSDRSEVEFTLSEGILSSISMSLLLSASVAENVENETIIVPKREGPFGLDANSRHCLEYFPVSHKVRKTFIYEYDRDMAQKKIYGKLIRGIISPLTGQEKPCIEFYEDKELTKLADTTKSYIVDYGFEYKDNALIYLIQKERFNGLFSLEGKFYTKDENDGLNYTNLIYMPKVRVVSDINLRLGERVDPAVAVFSIIGLPEKTADSNNLIMKITRLNRDIDADI